MIPCWTFKFKSTGISAIVTWDPTTKCNSHQYFQLYGIHNLIAATRTMYSGTSDRRQSLLRTQYKKTLCIKEKISCPKLYFSVILPLKRGNLPIKDNLGKNELVPRCPLFRGFTMLWIEKSIVIIFLIYTCLPSLWGHLPWVHLVYFSIGVCVCVGGGGEEEERGEGRVKGER